MRVGLFLLHEEDLVEERGLGLLKGAKHGCDAKQGRELGDFLTCYWIEC